MWYQYTIMYYHGVTNAGGLWILNFQPHMFQGFQLDYFHIQTNKLCINGQIIGGGYGTGRSYLG